MKQPGISIRIVLVTLGALSIMVAVGLAGFGYFGIQLQLDARKRVVLLEEALTNHVNADNFMDDVRADVLRALQSSVGTNKEGDEAIRAEFRHHADVVSTAIAGNLALPLGPELHDSYVKIADMVATFLPSGQRAVELALSDTAAGSANFELFRHDFSALEQRMDGMRDVLQARVKEVRNGAMLTASRGEQLIVLSSALGVLLLMLITWVAVRIAQGITTDLAESREEAHRLALHDALTGLPNRVFLADRLAQALDHARRHKTRLAVLCLDLDRFKQVNDTLGHPVGDALLRDVADRLRGCVRKGDTVARLGGDEFAIIPAPLDQVEEAGTLAQRIVETLSEPYDLNGHRVVIGASVGIAMAPDDMTDAIYLLNMADIALYRAKTDGRGIFRVFELGMDTKLQARRVLELDLRRAAPALGMQLRRGWPVPQGLSQSNQVVGLRVGSGAWGNVAPAAHATSEPRSSNDHQNPDRTFGGRLADVVWSRTRGGDHDHDNDPEQNRPRHHCRGAWGGRGRNRQRQA